MTGPLGKKKLVHRLVENIRSPSAAYSSTNGNALCSARLSVASANGTIIAPAGPSQVCIDDVLNVPMTMARESGGGASRLHPGSTRVLLATVHPVTRSPKANGAAMPIRGPANGLPVVD